MSERKGGREGEGRKSFFLACLEREGKRKIKNKGEGREGSQMECCYCLTVTRIENVKKDFREKRYSLTLSSSSFLSSKKQQKKC